MDEVRVAILSVERQLHDTQMQHAVGKLSTKRAKLRIRALNERLDALLRQLPADQRELYLFEKQFGVGV